MTHNTSALPMRPLSVGEVIAPTSSDENYLVLACELLHPSDRDSFAAWVTLCHLPHNTLHPFAVFIAYDRSEGWTLAYGDYHENIVEAVRVYEGKVSR